MNPKETIQAFWGEMVQWEVGYYKIIKTNDYKNDVDDFCQKSDNLAKNTLVDIVGRYLTEKAINTIGAAKLLSMGVGRPPIYDQIIAAEFEERAKSAAVITTRGSGGMISPFCKYQLAKDESGWKIKELYHSQDKSEWRKAKSL